MRSLSTNPAATPTPIIQDWADDPRFAPIEGGLLYVGNTSGAGACSTTGYGLAGACLMHADIRAGQLVGERLQS